MAFNDIFMGEEELLCSESIGYGDLLYNSPTYSDDSGLGQAFSLDDILFTDTLPPMTEDLEFTESIKELNRSNSVSSSIHDHSYFINSNEMQQKQNEVEIKVPQISDNCATNNRVVKRKKSESSSKENEAPFTKKTKSDSQLFQETESSINVLKCDEETFSYRDENGKIVIVDRSRKNAEMAKLNRQRKKRYVSNLESEVKSLRGRNDKLMQLKSQNENKIKNLENEVAYLMSVIRNQTKLSSVLRAVSSVPGVSLANETDSKSNRKINIVERLPGKRAPVEIKEEEYSGGVCLHVSDNKVSLEFCAACNKNQIQ